MPKKPEMTLKLKRLYHRKNEYEDSINAELMHLLQTNNLQSIKSRHRAKIGKKKVKTTVTFNEDGPIFGMSVVEAVSIVQD